MSENPVPLVELLEKVNSGMARTKLQAIKSLRLLSENSPEPLYPHFAFFANLLRSNNGILRWNSMLVIGNLARVDCGRNIERIIEEYLAPITGPLLIDAASTIQGAAEIALAKPHLADQIAKRILRVADTTYKTPECRNVAIGHAITALNRLFPTLTDKPAIQRFVAGQATNKRPATRKRAEKFLHKWAGVPA